MLLLLVGLPVHAEAEVTLLTDDRLAAAWFFGGSGSQTATPSPAFSAFQVSLDAQFFSFAEQDSTVSPSLFSGTGLADTDGLDTWAESRYRVVFQTDEPTPYHLTGDLVAGTCGQRISRASRMASKSWHWRHRTEAAWGSTRAGRWLRGSTSSGWGRPSRAVWGSWRRPSTSR